MSFVIPVWNSVDINGTWIATEAHVTRGCGLNNY